MEVNHAFVKCGPLAAAFFFSTAAFSAGYPVYDNGVLTLPRVDALDQVGKYQDATFRLTPQGIWELLGGHILGIRKLEPAPVSGVEVIKTGTLPVNVYLRVSGGEWNCAGLPSTNFPACKYVERPIFDLKNRPFGILFYIHSRIMVTPNRSN